MNREKIPQRILLLCWTSPREIWYCLYLWICAVLTLTMRYPTELSCCAVFSLEKYAVAYIREFLLSWLRPWGIQLNLLSYTSDERIAEWTPRCLYYSLYFERKLNRFSHKMFFAEETLPNHLFHLYNTSFLSCECQHLLFVEDISISCNS